LPQGFGRNCFALIYLPIASKGASQNGPAHIWQTGSGSRTTYAKPEVAGERRKGQQEKPVNLAQPA
jgi:hypothetical protein